MPKINNSLEGYAALEDILGAVNNADNNHVEVINRLDKITEVLERIASALEAPKQNPELLDALELISPALAEMYRGGRVS